MHDWLCQLRRLAAVAPEVLRYGGSTFNQIQIGTAVRGHYISASPPTKEMLVYGDVPESSDINAIFPMHPESLLLADLIGGPDREGDRFIDVGTGSGLLALVAAQRGWVSVGNDISFRSLRAARMNSRVNGVVAHFCCASVLTSIRSSSIDLCFANLPFEPTGSSLRNFVHSDGGPLGISVIAELLCDLERVLSHRGRAIVFAFALIDDGSSLLTRLAAEKIGSRRRCVSVKLSPSFKVEMLAGRFASNASVGDFFAELRRNGLGEFRLELLCVGSHEDRAIGVEEVDLQIADERWIYPFGCSRLAVPESSDPVITRQSVPQAAVTQLRVPASDSPGSG